MKIQKAKSQRIPKPFCNIYIGLIHDATKFQTRIYKIHKYFKICHLKKTMLHPLSWLQGYHLIWSLSIYLNIGLFKDLLLK